MGVLFQTARQKFADFFGQFLPAGGVGLLDFFQRSQGVVGMSFTLHVEGTAILPNNKWSET